MVCDPVVRHVRLVSGRDCDVVDALSWRFAVFALSDGNRRIRPFFLFTLPAGAIADIVNRRTVIVGAVLWQALWSAILAFGAWTDVLNPGAVLACIFALGIGLAFGAPVWGAVVPDIVKQRGAAIGDHAGRGAT